MLLERRWLRIGFATRRMAQRENHDRNVMHRMLAAAQNNPGDEQEAEDDESDEKILPMLLNQPIQKLGHTRDIRNRVFHTTLLKLLAFRFSSDQKHSKLRANNDLQPACILAHSLTTHIPRLELRLKNSSRGETAVSSGNSLSFRLLLALDASNRTPGRATDLGNDAFLLVFR